MKRFTMWLLGRLGLSAPLAGDIAEEYERRGSTWWAWRQALTASVLSLTLRKAVGLLAVASAVWMAVTIGHAWVRSPRLVAQLEESGKLELGPGALSDWQRCALIAVQDPGFDDHLGVGLFQGRLGHVTVTQVVAKRLFGYERSFYSKSRVMAMSLALDRKFSKDDQLRIFLNQVYLGAMGDEQIAGFAAASRAYFDSGFGEITDDEFLALVVMVFAPNGWNVLKHPDRNADQVHRFRSVAKRSCRPSPQTEAGMIQQPTSWEVPSHRGSGS